MAPGTLDRMTARAASAASYLAIAIGFTLPISTAADNVLLALLLICWLASGRWAAKYELIRRNPVVLSALAYLALMVLGLTWSPDPLHDGLTYLKKYSDLLLIPILVTVFIDPQDRRRGLLALAVGIALTLLLSLALSAGALPTGGFITGDPANPTVFKKHITQNILMAFGCLLCVELARTATRSQSRVAWSVLALLAAFNVLFLVQGRTGYLVIAALVVLVLLERLRWKGLVAAVLIVGVGFAGAYEFSEAFRSRILQVHSEAEQWHPDVASETSVGSRLEFWRNSLAIVKQHPWVGVGTGGFVHAYAEKVQGTEMRPTRNPHNQYLLTAVEVGAGGVVLLLFLFVQEWRCATRLPDKRSKTLARGLVLTIAVGCLFNSLLIDHVESLLFAWLSGLLFAALPVTRAASEASG